MSPAGLRDVSVDVIEAALNFDAERGESLHAGSRAGDGLYRAGIHTDSTIPATVVAERRIEGDRSIGQQRAEPKSGTPGRMDEQGRLPHPPDSCQDGDRFLAKLFDRNTQDLLCFIHATGAGGRIETMQTVPQSGVEIKGLLRK